MPAPQRPPKPAGGDIYSRFIPELNQTFILEPLALSHLHLLHDWHNQPRVNAFWSEAGDEAKITQFIQSRIDDAHTLAVIGSYQSPGGEKEPAVYVEIYWALEDKLAEYYEAKDYDRGIHMLVGSINHRGPHRIKAWLPSICHYIFQHEARTTRIVAEPNAKNDKMISYLQSIGFNKEKEFDFPHKRAALMVLDRNDFVKHHALEGL